MKSSSLYKFAILEVILLIVFFYLVTWIILPYFINPVFWQIALFWAFSIIAGWYILYYSPRLHGESLESRGLGGKETLFIRKDNLRSSAPSYLLFFAALIFVLAIMIYLKYGTFNIDVDIRLFFIKYILYVVSATIQDIIFFSFIFSRLKLIAEFMFAGCRHKQLYTVSIFALLFSFFHYPNYHLMFLSFGFGFGIGWIFYTKPNLFWVSFIHAISGVILHRVYQLHMKIGILYNQSSTDASFFRKTVPWINEIIGSNW